MIILYQKALICIYEIRAFILQLRRLEYIKISRSKEKYVNFRGVNVCFELLYVMMNIISDRN